MANATIAVRGNASAEFPADFSAIHFQHQYTTSARSDALAHGNDVIAQLREVGARANLGVRETKVRSLQVEEAFTGGKPPDHIRTPSGWSSLVTGETLVDVDTVPEVVAALTKVGVSIVQISWHLEAETEAAARRAVRRQAVADALVAANDFAAALNGKVGNLITLADPGLLGAGNFAASARGAVRAASAFATLGSSPAQWDERVDIDPYAITVAASVEASYEMILA